MKVSCIEQLQLGGSKTTFRTGEEYTGNEVNGHWWIVDSVGISSEDFHLHFEVIGEDADREVITEQEVCAPAYNRHIQWAEPDILLDWLGEHEGEEKEIPSWFKRLKQWYDDWEIIQWYR